MKFPADGSPHGNNQMMTQFIEYGRFFAERRSRADFVAFDRLMRRKRGEAPHTEDTIR